MDDEGLSNRSPDFLGNLQREFLGFLLIVR